MMYRGFFKIKHSLKICEENTEQINDKNVYLITENKAKPLIT